MDQGPLQQSWERKAGLSDEMLPKATEHFVQAT